MAPQSRQTAEEKTALVRRQAKALDEMLTSVLSVPPVTFERLMVSPPAARFDPGPLAVPLPAPSWEGFRPVRLTRLGRGRGPGRGRGRFGRQVAEARARFEAAVAEHERSESERRQALAAAKVRHDRQVTAERAQAAEQNAAIARQRSAFAAGDAQAVEWYVCGVLAASRYPGVFPRDYQVAYRALTRDVVVEAELPPRRIVPSARAFRYVSSRDCVEPVPRPDAEIRQRFRRLTAAIALRTLHEIFAATPPEVVAAVAFNGRLGSADPATGQAVRPCLVSMAVGRAAFGELVLSAVDPVACLAHLGARLSPDPFGLEAVEPLIGLPIAGHPG